MQSAVLYAVGGADNPLNYRANVGIVNLDVRSNPDNPEQRAVFATILNVSTNQQDLRAELVFDDKVVGVKSLSLKPKESSPQVFIAERGSHRVER